MKRSLEIELFDEFFNFSKSSRQLEDDSEVDEDGGELFPDVDTGLGPNSAVRDNVNSAVHATPVYQALASAHKVVKEENIQLKKV